MAAVCVDRLCKTFGARQVLRECSFGIEPGQIVALLGPNGAGKSTLIGCLLGFLLPDTGMVHVFGEAASGLTAATRARTGFVPQAMAGFGWFRVGELIDYLAAFYAQPPGPPDRRLLGWADLDPGARVKTLSGGQRQRLAIVLGMRHDPELLILDEPVASLDPQARRDFMSLLGSYADRADGPPRTVLISSHILSDLERIATQALFIARGQVVHDTSMQRFRLSTRWLLPGATDPVLLRAALPDSISVLAAADGALLVDGWSDQAAAQVQARAGAIDVRTPDLEAAFLDITR